MGKRNWREKKIILALVKKKRDLSGEELENEVSQYHFSGENSLPYYSFQHKGSNISQFCKRGDIFPLPIISFYFFFFMKIRS